MKVAGIILAKDRLYCLPHAIQSLLDYVDQVYVQVDDTSQPDVTHWLANQSWPEHFGWGAYHFNEDTGFAGAYNAAIEHCQADWIIQLDSDETIQPKYATNIKSIVHEAHQTGHDAIESLMLHWLDKERTRHREDVHPHYPTRLYRGEVRYRWRVHSDLTGYKKPGRVSPERLTLEHWNMVYRSQDEWGEVNERYDRLLALDRADGRQV